MKHLNLLKRLDNLESTKKHRIRREYVFAMYEDFKGPKAMRVEFSKEKYRGCVIILNDIP